MMRYTESHEWVRVEGESATVGVTDFAQAELGDIVFVELPEVGKRAEAGKEAAVLESTKAAADVYAPLTGEITAVNETLREAPALVNSSAEERGWLFKMRVENGAELESLLDEAGYQELVS